MNIFLPYKVNELQALNSWRTDFASMFADSLERMSSCSLFRISSFQATEVINNNLIKKFNPTTVNNNDLPNLDYSPLTRLNIPVGTCDELCAAGLSMFRAAGVPCAIDYTPLWGYGNRGHSWAVVLAPNGKDIPFIPIFMSPYTQHKINETLSKVYRRTYAINYDLEELNRSGEYVPETFKSIFQKDITAKYTITRDLEFKDSILRNHKYIYLCNSSRDVWKPVAISKVKGDKVIFKDVGKGCIYRILSYDKNGLEIPLYSPFIIDRDGKFKYITPNLDSLINVTLYRKSPLFEYAWQMAVLLENGYFEASNNADFSNSFIVGKVKELADRAVEIVVDDKTPPFRYWRFIKRDSVAKCSLGELKFYGYNNDGSTLIGNPIWSSSGKVSISKADVKAAFDNDVLTSFSIARENEAWVGLDFGYPTKVHRILCYSRSDGNMIEPGDEYELMYWDNNEWNSLCKKIATSVSIDFNNIPSNALYLLLNRTKGDSVRIFMLDEKGNQQWW